MKLSSVEASERKIPRGYGLAIQYVDRHEYVVFPIPFNYVAGWAYRLWTKLKVGPTDWQSAYDKAYHKGLDDGHDFGKRIAYNQVLTKEISGILSRYSQLQVRIMNKPKAAIQKELEEFTRTETERFKMELQDR